MAKGKGTATIYYYATNTLNALQKQSISLDSDEFTSYSLDLVAPADSQCMYIEFDTFNGEKIQIDNVNLLQK